MVNLNVKVNAKVKMNTQEKVSIIGETYMYLG